MREWIAITRIEDEYGAYTGAVEVIGKTREEVIRDLVRGEWYWDEEGDIGYVASRVNTYVFRDPELVEKLNRIEAIDTCDDYSDAYAAMMMDAVYRVFADEAIHAEEEDLEE